MLGNRRSLELPPCQPFPCAWEEHGISCWKLCQGMWRAGRGWGQPAQLHGVRASEDTGRAAAVISAFCKAFDTIPNIPLWSWWVGRGLQWGNHGAGQPCFKKILYLYVNWWKYRVHWFYRGQGQHWSHRHQLKESVTFTTMQNCQELQEKLNNAPDHWQRIPGGC